MNAWRLPDGRVLVPKRAKLGIGLVGDGLMAVDAESQDAKDWAQWTLPAPPDVIAYWKSIEDARG